MKTIIDLEFMHVIIRDIYLLISMKYLEPSILMKYLIRWKWKDTMMPIFSCFIKAIKKNNK